MTLRARFLGQAERDTGPLAFLEGVPARDLDEDDYRALSGAQRAAVRQSALYDVRTDQEMADSATPATANE